MDSPFARGETGTCPDEMHPQHPDVFRDLRRQIEAVQIVVKTDLLLLQNRDSGNGLSRHRTD